MCHDWVSVAPGLTGLPAGSLLRLLQQSLPRDWADGELQSCAEGIRTARSGWRSSPMNSTSYMGQTPLARCMNAHYQFMEPPNTPCFSSNCLYSPCLKGSGAFFFFLSFLSTNFDNSNFRSMTSYESHAGKRSHVFEASRPLHLFDQQLGCEFCRSESGSEAPWGRPFMPATSRG